MFRYPTDTYIAAASIIWTCLAGYNPLVSAHAKEAIAVPDIEQTYRDGRFTSLFEPSGIATLDKTGVSTRYLIVEDEAVRALHVVDFTDTDDKQHLNEKVITLGKGFFQRQMLGRLDDLEGAARGMDSRLYVITSHDDAYKGKQSNRQKLISFSLSDQGDQQPLMRKNLYASLMAQYPELAEKFRKSRRDASDRLNVESLAFDRKRQHLLIGFRSPRLSGNAVVVVMKNPQAYLQEQAEPDWAKDLWTLDLEKGGLRAMTYDDPSDNLIVVSQRESGKAQRYKLWTVAADGQSAPLQIHSDDKNLFDNVEGLTSTPDGVVFVKDDGNRRKKRGASWFVLQRRQLGIDSP